MTKSDVLKAFKDIMNQKPELLQKIYYTTVLPEEYYSQVLAISSIDLIDLIIQLESLLQIEINDTMLIPMLTVDELAERIVYYAK